MALYELREILTDRIVNLIEWDGIEPFYSGSDYYTVLNTDPSVWQGSFPASEKYIDIYGGEFYGVFHGLHIGNTEGSSSYSTSASFAESSSYVFSGSLDHIDHLGFDTASITTPTEGTFVWNDGDGTLDLGLKGGNVTLQVGEQTYAMVYNNEATQLNVGEVVYITGAQGNRIQVERAYSDTDDHSANTLGFVAEPIAAGAEGLVITNGTLKKLNTNGLTAGAIVYLGSTPGTYTTTKPTAPTHTVVLGFIERVHLSVGSIYVKVDNGYELNELHNVHAVTPTFGDLLTYSGSVWTGSKILSGSYTLSGSLNISGSLTGSLYGSASFATTSSFTTNIKAGFAPTSAVQQTGSGQYIYNISFTTNYLTNNYAVSVQSTSDLRIWTVENRTTSGFRINSNSTVATTGDIYWITVPYNS